MAGGSPCPCVSGLAFVAYCNQLAFIRVYKLLVFKDLHLFLSFLQISLVLLAVRWQCRLSCTTQHPNPKPPKTMTKILHYFFQNNGVIVVFRDGTVIRESTPPSMTGHEHLQQIISK